MIWPFANVQRSDLDAATESLRDVAVETPVLESPVLNAITDARVLIKLESLQTTGAFKLRGAYNMVAQLPRDVRARGVVTASSGNQALGLAYAARKFSVPCVVVVPENAPRMKIDKIQSLGAEVVIREDAVQNYAGVTSEVAARRDMVAVSSYENPQIVAGQATVALELLRQAARAECQLDSVLVCCGGGSLTSGCVLAFHGTGIRTVCVEPVGFDTMARSIGGGLQARARNDATTICDALRVPFPGRLTTDICRVGPVDCVTVSDSSVISAIRFAFEHFRVVLEPGGAAALAALLGNPEPYHGTRLGVVCSGGNVDPGRWAELLWSR